MNNKFILSYLFLSTFLISIFSLPTKSQIPAIFDTKAEAEQAAKNFNCTGAHKMGNKWMPCKSHKTHEENQIDSGHVHHHNH